jgi:hypothetical protein
LPRDLAITTHKLLSTARQADSSDQFSLGKKLARPELSQIPPRFSLGADLALL